MKRSDVIHIRNMVNERTGGVLVTDSVLLGSQAELCLEVLLHLNVKYRV